MTDVFTASIQEKLWHKMRRDLASFVPEIAGNDLLMCCACGRFLPQEFFDLEHLIPQRVLKHDPAVVRANPETPANTRSGNLLLCKKPLRVKGNILYKNGCNSWKGRHFDKPISELVSTKALNASGCAETHIIAAMSLCYLAMVAEYGYIVALMRSGLILREQFFRPFKILREMPLRSQMVAGGGNMIEPDAPVWATPFSFDFSRPGFCVVGARNFVVLLPISRDPRIPIAKHLRIVPEKYKLRPSFKTVFD